MPIRTCIICGKTQYLKGEIRSNRCKSCWAKSGDMRRGTGKDWYVNKKLGYLVKTENAKYKMQHRENMENYLGRKLKRKEIVHHINGNKIDNRIENLEIIKQSEHMLKHHDKNYYTKISKLGHKARWGYEPNI